MQWTFLMICSFTRCFVQQPAPQDSKNQAHAPKVRTQYKKWSKQRNYYSIKVNFNFVVTAIIIVNAFQVKKIKITRVNFLCWIALLIEMLSVKYSVLDVWAKRKKSFHGFVCFGESGSLNISFQIAVIDAEENIHIKSSKYWLQNIL